MRKTGLLAASILLVGSSLAACGGGDDSGSAKTITYWASNQAPSVQLDQKILKPELAKFTKKTGVKVKLQVIDWNDLLKKILTATTSGQGPDVLNIGNTWASSLQATGAFAEFDAKNFQKIGGKDKFVSSTLATAGPPGKTPTSVPLYGLVYGMFYNKKMFADAGIDGPPKTWSEFVADGKKLTKPDKKQWGLAVAGAQYTENSHHAFILGQQQGGGLFNGTDPQFTKPSVVDGIKQYIDFMATDKIVNPTNAEFGDGTKAPNYFAKGHAAMLLWQNNAMGNLADAGMKSDEYGVAPIPLPDPMPAGGKKVRSHAAGINISVFKNSENMDASMKLVKFLTDPAEQVHLNKKFKSLPVNKQAAGDSAFSTGKLKVFQDVLADSSAPMPLIPDESQFETLVGTAMKSMFADAAAGKPITDAYVKSKLAAAQQKMSNGS